MITLTINDQKIEVEEGTTILEAARILSIDIPTLCYHKALSPYGACRLCIVEIVRGDQGQIAASCLYPAQDGLIVKTHSERVLKNRRIMAELLLARCPDSAEIKDLARELGVVKTRLALKNEDCTLCGLCVRMCSERMGISAVSFVNRGSKREVITPFGALSDVCQTCGACVSICPTGRIKLEEITGNKPRPLLSEFDEGLIQRKPINILYPQAVPRVAAIDKQSCVHTLKDKCGICMEMCEAGAIDYEQKEKELNLEVGAVVVAPGYDKFDARLRGEYGYGRYKNVVTSLQFERILSSSGPFGGHLQRLSDGKEPKKIAWIQCVGSRDPNKGNDYCSAVCCTYAVKEAIIAREHAAEGLDTAIFYIDMRTFGKGFEEYYNRARDEYGVRFVRSRVAEVVEIDETKNLLLRYEDEEEDKIKEEEFDLVVLSIGLTPKEGAKEIAERLGIELNEYGFCQTSDFAPVNTNKPGVYVAGVFEAPKDIPETVMQASSAAAEAGCLLAEARGSLITPKEYPPEIDVSGQEPRIGVFVCHCGINIAGVVDVPAVVKYVRTLPNVVHTENNLYTCSQDTQKAIIEKIKEHNLNRVIVASCTPRTHETLFCETIRQAGLNPYLFEMANIRDQCSWVHQKEPEAATSKAKDLIRIAAAKSRLSEPLYPKFLKVKQSALVIGGGLSGMTAALSLAEQGFETHLVEKEAELGGLLRRVRYLLNGDDPLKRLDELMERVKRHKNIHVYANATVSKVEGSIGNFKSEIRNPKSEITIEHGVVIVATGASELKPKEYLYGEDDRVITQLQLEGHLSNPQSAIRNPQSVVMIQCVGSREPDRPYCSRVCCQEAIKNALKLKEINPRTEVYILYRDIRSYGFNEIYYQQARQKGVIFIRYDEDNKPQIRHPQSAIRNPIEVQVKDPVLGADLLIEPDLLVLSPAIVPGEENSRLSQILKTPLDQNGFFLEAHMKLRPVESATDGIYLCGLAHGPKTVDEAISQARAAASRAATILSKEELELEAALSFVVDANCDGCAYCIDPCPFKALTLIEYMKDGAIKKTVESDESKCKGCGVCMATCPKQGIYVRHFKLEMLQAMIEAALQPV